MSDVREAVGVTQEWHERCQKRMRRHDTLPPEIRALVYEFGSTIVNDFLNCGVTNPRHIRHLVLRIAEGASSQNANGGAGLIRSRCADLGMLVGGMRDDDKQDCIDAFLASAQPSKRRA